MSQSTSANAEQTTIILETFASTSSGKFAVAWVEIDSPTGLFVVGPGYSETISLIKPGGTLVYQTTDGTQGSFVAPGGIAIIQNDVVKLILYTEPAEPIF